MPAAERAPGARMRGLRSARLLAAGAVFALAGCATPGSTIGFYLQSIGGHLSMMQKAQPIQALIDDPATDAALRERLRTVAAIRRFASDELGLPDNGSYTRYADLGRPFVLWNVFAAPELSLRLREWCFPVAGCIVYRGWYAKEDAEREAAALRAQGLDVQVSGVPAYSTLGWFDDPVLNTFVQYPAAELARLLFHELAHQVAYVKGDSTFNESFATAVEQAGVQRWLAARNDPALARSFETFSQRRLAFLELLRRKRAELEAVYASGGSDGDRRRGKSAVFASLQDDYAALKAGWDGWAGYDRFFAQTLGNAHLAAIGTYTDGVPGFLRMLDEQGGDLPRFYAAVRALAKLDRPERDRRLGIAPPPAQADPRQDGRHRSGFMLSRAAPEPAEPGGIIRAP